MPLARAGDVNLEYYIEGEGPPLLMIMGFGGQASSWGEPFLQELRPHFRIIRFSNRGTGLSDRPAGPTTIAQMADDAAALLEAVGIPRAHVFGVSMGGMIAQEFALRHAGRLGGLVLGCTTPGGPRAATASPETIALLVPAPGLSREEQIRRAWPAICSPAFIESSLNFLEAMLAASLTNPTPIATLGQQMAAVQGHDTYGRLPQIKAPTLVLHGDLDLLVPPENGRILAERIPGAVLRLIPGAAHMFFWEQPEASAREIVQFLSRTPAPA
jgi:pimeloyl-ACP methyl ester carboxylesterase